MTQLLATQNQQAVEASTRAPEASSQLQGLTNDVRSTTARVRTLETEHTTLMKDAGELRQLRERDCDLYSGHMTNMVE